MSYRSVTPDDLTDGLDEGANQSPRIRLRCCQEILQGEIDSTENVAHAFSAILQTGLRADDAWKNRRYFEAQVLQVTPCYE